MSRERPGHGCAVSPGAEPSRAQASHRVHARIVGDESVLVDAIGQAGSGVAIAPARSIGSMRTDGTHLRQLTHARGMVREPHGTVSSENVGPMASSSFVAAQ